MPVLKSIKQHKILLDTHVWLWALTGQDVLSKTFCTALEQARRSRTIHISPMSIWEIGMLVDKKRISLEMDVLDWINQALEIPGTHLSEITARIAILSTQLPGEIHGDPVDRILIATAHEEGAVLVTCDAKILEYGKDRFFSVYDPS